MTDKSCQSSIRGERTESMLLDAWEAAALCGMSRAAWYKRLSTGQVPRPVKIGSLARWRKDELIAWIAAGCPPRTKWDSVKWRK